MIDNDRRVTQPLAAATDPELIQMTGEATTSLVAANATSELGVRVRIVASELPGAKRPPLNLGLVLDTSGSMEGKAIAELRRSARQLVEKLRPGDRVSVVTFHSRAEVLVPGTVIDATSQPRVLAAIEAIRATGTTDLAAGLAAGLAQVQAGQAGTGQGGKAIHRIVLLSDGVPNASAQLPAIVAGIRQYGFSITTLGLGIDYDTALMTQLAQGTGGTFHYVEEPEQVAAVFDDELTRMTTAVGKNLVLTLSPGPGVTFQPMQGLSIGGDGKANASLGDLPAGEVRDLMIPIKVAARGDASTAELVDAALAFDDVVNQAGRLGRAAFVSVKASSDAAEVRRAVKIDLEAARVRTTAASAILEAIALARQGAIAEAQARIAAAAAAVRAAAARLEDAELGHVLRELEDVSKQLAQLVVPAPQVGLQDASPARGPAGGPRAMRPVAPATAPAPVERKLRRAQEKASATVTGEAW
ncbi:MAG TPA: VWA domain-containing protein [Kofleriaceae bacterium]|nr:VWA domain-containing protein [Kofleriaceae bacterium]